MAQAEKGLRICVLVACVARAGPVGVFAVQQGVKPSSPEAAVPATQLDSMYFVN